MSMNIKVCGITQLKQLQQLDALNVPFAGLIFHKASPRYVVDKISKDELKGSDFDLKKVGVFVNADYDEIIDYTTDPELIHEKYKNLVDIVIAGGYGNNNASTVVDCTNNEYTILRQGLGILEDYL